MKTKLTLTVLLLIALSAGLAGCDKEKQKEEEPTPPTPPIIEKTPKLTHISVEEFGLDVEDYYYSYDSSDKLSSIRNKTGEFNLNLTYDPLFICGGDDWTQIMTTKVSMNPDGYISTLDLNVKNIYVYPPEFEINNTVSEYSFYYRFAYNRNGELIHFMQDSDDTSIEWNNHCIDSYTEEENGSRTTYKFLNTIENPKRQMPMILSDHIIGLVGINGYLSFLGFWGEGPKKLPSEIISSDDGIKYSIYYEFNAAGYITKESVTLYIDDELESMKTIRYTYE